MNYLLQILKAFLDGFFPIFGVLVVAGGGWYIYENSLSEFSQLPIIQEITDTYQVGWEKTSNLGERFVTQLILLDRQGYTSTWATKTEASITDTELKVYHTWKADKIITKLAAEGWSDGKLKAAYAYLAYIEEYLDEALYDMYNSGVSASITIAQGILESDAGRSRLARVTNNHFGIKALPNKRGRKKIKARQYAQLRDEDFSFKPPAFGVSQHHDDHKYDRFEAYYTVQDSYRRHSRLLQNDCTKARKGCYNWIWKEFPVQKEPLDISKMAFRFQGVSGFGPKDFFGDTTLPYYAAQAAGLKMAGYATSKKYHKKLVYLIETYELWRLDTALVQALSS